MQKTIVNTMLRLPAEKVWEVLGAVGGVDQWSPVITTCRLESSPVGGLQRICGSDQGELKEKILTLDHERKVLRYAIVEQPFLPVSALVTTIEVAENGSGTDITTTVTYELHEGANPAEIEAAMTQIYTSSYAGIEQLVAAAA